MREKVIRKWENIKKPKKKDCCNRRKNCYGCTTGKFLSYSEDNLATHHYKNDIPVKRYMPYFKKTGFTILFIWFIWIVFKECQKIGEVDIVTQMFVFDASENFNDREGFNALKKRGMVHEYKNDFVNVYNLYII